MDFLRPEKFRQKEEFAMKIALSFTALVFLGVVATPAQAQISNSFGSVGGGMGSMGGRSMGVGISAGNRTFSGGGSMGGLGQSGLGGGAGLLDSSDRFIRGNRRPGEFVGAGGMQPFVGSVQSGGMSGLGSWGGRNNFMNRGNQRNQNFNLGGQNFGGRGGSSAGPRLSIKLGFNPPSMSPPHVSATLAKRLTDIPGLKTRGPVEVWVQGDKATLRGTVATDHDRDLAERLVLLEPGIYRVQNDLTVGSVPSWPAK